MLHPGIRNDNQVSTHPGSKEYHECCEGVSTLTKASFSKKKKTQERRFYEKRKYSLHGKNVANHSAREDGKPGPVCSELEFHWNSGHHAHRKIYSKDASPELRCMIVGEVETAEGD
jgi:hypothetical protein